jgi:hypothetical protein
MSWFHSLTGFHEQSWAETRASFDVDGGTLRSRVNGRAWAIGRLETPSVAELRARAESVAGECTGRLRVTSVMVDVARLHRDAANRHALFQVASQFNLLEMIGPEVTPEDGVTRYEQDHTQGPACAIAAGAATIYRNYFVPVGGDDGQTAHRQIDCLADVGVALGNEGGRLWRMRNGYALATADGLAVVRERLAAVGTAGRDALRDRLRVGVHRGVEVTAGDAGHLVSQVFCSAPPVAYTSVPARDWAPFATLVLEGAYEATLWAAVLNHAATGSPVVYLTHLGGGAFGNERAWIDAALRRALTLVRGFALDVRVVSYGAPGADIRRLVEEFAA